jgi:hypothetical protein
MAPGPDYHDKLLDALFAAAAFHDPLAGQVGGETGNIT